MTATLPDRDAHAGAAADAARDRADERAAKLAWAVSQHDATGQLGTIARMLDDYRTMDRARVVPLYDADGDVLLVYQQVSDLIDKYERAVYLLAVYAKRAPVAQAVAA